MNTFKSRTLITTDCVCIKILVLTFVHLRHQHIDSYSLDELNFYTTPTTLNQVTC